MADIRAHLHISGRVQGVFYRYTTEREAGRRGLTGWVRNLPGGSVEAVVEGPETTVEEMIEWCRQGPPGARVDRVDVRRSQATGEFDGFRIAY